MRKAFVYTNYQQKADDKNGKAVEVIEFVPVPTGEYVALVVDEKGDVSTVSFERLKLVVPAPKPVSPAKPVAAKVNKK